MFFVFTECALVVLSSKLRGHSAKQPTVPVKGFPDLMILFNSIQFNMVYSSNIQ